MHETAISLPVVLPEAVLALGTLLLVLYGALRGERAYNLVTEVSVALLGIVFILVVAKNRPMGITFYGAFADDAFTRFMSGLALVGSLVTLLLSLEFMRSERIAGFEFPVLILLSTLGMLMLISAGDFIALYLGLELMSLALYVDRRLPAQRSARHRGRPQVFRPRRPFIGHAALRRFADLRLCGLGVVQRRRRRRARPSQHRRAVRPRVRAGGARVQDLGRALPHVDAGRVRRRADSGDDVLRLRAEDRGDGRPRPRRAHRLPRHHQRLAADPHLRLDRLDGARRLRRHRPDQLQAADGLFVDRPHGLRPGRPRGRHGRGRAERHRLHGDLCRHDARDFRRHSLDAPRRPAGRDHRRSRGPRADRFDQWRFSWRR